MADRWNLKYLIVWTGFSIMRLKCTNAEQSMYTSKFQKQDHVELQVKLLDGNDVISLLECSTFCQDGCDGFAFCRSAQSKCFRFVFVDAADATNLSTLSACSFYTSGQRQVRPTVTYLPIIYIFQCVSDSQTFVFQCRDGKHLQVNSL